ncbi:MAG: GatB/YqeY domain-containing protein [Gammaproteobacteria bacterium]|jgi:uncharacterized protein YqeY
MSLRERLLEDTKTAMRAQDKARLGVLRLISAAIKQREVDERITLDDPQVLAVLEKMVKQRRESIAQYEQGGRQDLADKEQAEIAILQDYLPEPLSEAELDALIDTVIADTGAESIRDMGKVMGAIKSRAQGRADMGLVGARVKARLGG